MAKANGSIIGKFIIPMAYIVPTIRAIEPINEPNPKYVTNRIESTAHKNIIYQQ